MAEGDRQKALSYLKAACFFTDLGHNAIQAAFEAGTVPHDRVLDAIRAKRDLRLRFLKVYRVYGDPKQPVPLLPELGPGEARQD